ncbi:MAG: Rieske 2Fe-2S domain-containing protein, partial [Pseudomonadota bacterium]
CAALVGTLHVIAAWGEHQPEREEWAVAAGWINAGDPRGIEPGRARIVALPGGERVALFRHGEWGEKLSAVTNVCAHQNGPLGEGRIVDGCVTCPWHGFQFDPEDGCAPAPFTDKIATYRLRWAKGPESVFDPNDDANAQAFRPREVEIEMRAQVPGTWLEPLILDGVRRPQAMRTAAREEV